MIYNAPCRRFKAVFKGCKEKSSWGFVEIDMRILETTPE